MSLKQKTALQLFISLISPVIGLYFAFKSNHRTFTVFAGTLFMGLVGSVFIYKPNTDGYSHLQSVYSHYLDMSFVDFIHYAYSLLLFQPTDVANDLYKHVLSYIAGGVFGIPELIHLFAGLILGYFYTKSLLLILEVNSKYRNGILVVVLIGMFLLIRSITALNSIRMWTGMWVFFYGAYAYIKRGNVKYLFVLVLSLLIHFSYAIFILPLGLAIAAKKHKRIISIVYISSFFISINYQTFIAFAPQDSELYQLKSGYILSEKRLEERAALLQEKPKDNFYTEYGPLFFKNYCIPFLSIILLLIYNFKRNERQLDFLIAGGLLLLALSNISSFSPSIAGRGNSLAATFLMAAGINFICQFNEYSFTPTVRSLVQSGFWLFFVSSIPYLLFNASYILNTVSMFILVNPLASWLIGDQDVSIRDAILFFF